MDKGAHDRQHQRLDSAWSLWKKGPAAAHGARIRKGDGRQARRTAALALTGHLAQGHGLTSGDIARALGKALGTWGLDDAKALHDRLPHG